MNRKELDALIESKIYSILQELKTPLDIRNFVKTLRIENKWYNNIIVSDLLIDNSIIKDVPLVFKVIAVEKTKMQLWDGFTHKFWLDFKKGKKYTIAADSTGAIFKKFISIAREVEPEFDEADFINDNE